MERALSRRRGRARPARLLLRLGASRSLSFPTREVTRGGRGRFLGAWAPRSPHPGWVGGAWDLAAAATLVAAPVPAGLRLGGPAPRPRGSGCGAARGPEPVRRVDCPESAAGAPRGEGAGGPSGGEGAPGGEGAESCMQVRRVRDARRRGGAGRGCLREGAQGWGLARCVGSPGGEGTRGWRPGPGWAAPSGRGKCRAPCLRRPRGAPGLPPAPPRPRRPRRPGLPLPDPAPRSVPPAISGREGPTPSHFPSILQPSGLLRPGNELAPPPTLPLPSPPPPPPPTPPHRPPPCLWGPGPRSSPGGGPGRRTEWPLLGRRRESSGARPGR